MTLEDINKSRIERGLQPLPVLGEVGYKGKGMCNTCFFSAANKNPNLKYIVCNYYAGAECRHVCRNCTGVKSLKQTEQNEPK